MCSCFEAGRVRPVAGSSLVFTTFLLHLRTAGVPVGTSEWLLLLRALSMGLATDVDGFYALGRSILCRTENDYDAYDLAFAAAFKDAALDPEVRARLEQWLANAKKAEGERVDPPFASDEELWKAFLERLKEQDGRHDGGSKWIGTGGTSAFGHSGRATRGVRVGGPGGGRGAIQVAEDRQWASYRTDKTLDRRDLSVALKALRRLNREGAYELDLDGTIHQTCRNAGDIELIERRAKQNQVRLVLLMDAGGSMSHHAERVAELFTAAEEIGTFRSFEPYFFHNCVYGWLWKNYETNEREASADVLARLTPQHRVVIVGDASMAPYELFSQTGWSSAAEDRIPGIDWLRRIRQRCPSSVWLNPDPRRFWDHPTVSAIGGLFPMHELSVDGLRDAVSVLRKPV